MSSGLAQAAHALQSDLSEKLPSAVPTIHSAQAAADLAAGRWDGQYSR